LTEEKKQPHYTILQGKEFIKDVKKLLKSGESSFLKNIQQGIDELHSNPHTKRPNADIKLISSKKEGIYRMRLGKYRLIYEVDESRKTIYLTMFFIRGKGY